jgi:hypothetical protein
MAKLEGKEKDRYRCQYCGFPVKQGRDSLGSYGEGGWDFHSDATVSFPSAGVDQITNGAFTANVNGWTAVNCTIASAGTGQSGNACTLTRTSGDSQYLYQSLSGLKFGVLYHLTAYVISGTSGDEAFALRLLDTDRSRTIYEKTGTSSSTCTQYELPFRSYHGNNVVALVKNSSTAGTMLFDTVELYEKEYSVIESAPGCPFCFSQNWKQSVSY